MRTVWIGGLGLFAGGMCLTQGAMRDTWELMVFGILFLSIAFGYLISGRSATRKFREHGQAMFRAAVIWRLLRRFR